MMCYTNIYVYIKLCAPICMGCCVMLLAPKFPAIGSLDRAYTHKNRFLFPFKLHWIWSWWQFYFLFWAKCNYVWFKIERKTVTTITFDSIWQEIYFYECTFYKLQYVPLTTCQKTVLYGTPITAFTRVTSSPDSIPSLPPISPPPPPHLPYWKKIAQKSSVQERVTTLLVGI